jgi:hypothetical protein
VANENASGSVANENASGSVANENDAGSVATTINAVHQEADPYETPRHE